MNLAVAPAPPAKAKKIQHANRKEKWTHIRNAQMKTAEREKHTSGGNIAMRQGMAALKEYATTQKKTSTRRSDQTSATTAM